MSKSQDPAETSTRRAQAHNSNRIMSELKDVTLLRSLRICFTPKFPIEILLSEEDILLLIKAVNLYLRYKGDCAAVKRTGWGEKGIPMSMKKLKTLLEDLLNSEPGALSPFRNAKEVL